MKVLLVDDDTDLLDFLASQLPERGFVVDVAGTGTEAIGQAIINTYNLIVLDLHLPDMSGEAVCRALAERKAVPPILMLTAVSSVDMKVRLLEAGADDYLQKPFSFEELVARMRALMRRTGRPADDVLVAGDLVFDVRQRIVRRGDQELQLTRTELSMLEYLMRHRGQVAPKSALIDHVWESSASPFMKALEVHMANLRRKLGDPTLIETIHSHGYRFE